MDVGAATGNSQRIEFSPCGEILQLRAPVIYDGEERLMFRE